MANVTGRSTIERAIYCAVEGTYGVDATPVATDAVFIENLKVEALQIDKVSRNIDRIGLGGTPEAMGPAHAKVSFDIPLTGSGALGVVPAYSTVIRSLQFNAVIDAGVSVTHNLVSGDMESMTIYYYDGDRLRKLIGFRGAAGFSVKSGFLPYLKVSGFAFYGAGVDGQSPPVPNFGNTQTPSSVSYVNTPEFTLNGVAMPMLDMDISTPSNVKYRNVPNQEEVRISGRRDYGGKISVLQIPQSQFAPEALALATSLIPMHVKHGTDGGNIFEIDAPKMQIVGVSEGESDGDATWELEAMFTATGSGDDDLVLKLT